MWDCTATVAASLDIPKETIAAALGHGGNTVTDIGFCNVDEVIKRLVPKFPSTIPMRSEVTFRIKDVDTKMEGIYARTKGKGF